MRAYKWNRKPGISTGHSTTGAATEEITMKNDTKQQAPQHLRLGEYHPHYGGHYAGIVRGEDGQPDYYLFVAPKDKGEAAALEFGGMGQRLVDAEHPSDGLANTTAMVFNAAEYPAAQFCAGITIDGHHDWYLPSRDELRILYANVRDLFYAAWYWSSTQYAGNHYDARLQNFSNGNQDSCGKDYKGRVRAVRRLALW